MSQRPLSIPWRRASWSGIPLTSRTNLCPSTRRRSASGALAVWSVRIDGVRPPREGEQGEERERRHRVEVRREASAERGGVDDPRSPGHALARAPERGGEEDDLVPAPRELTRERELPDRLGVRAREVPVANVEDAHRGAHSTARILPGEKP